jgi:hypothetical protein
MRATTITTASFVATPTAFIRRFFSSQLSSTNLEAWHCGLGILSRELDEAYQNKTTANGSNRIQPFLHKCITSTTTTTTTNKTTITTTTTSKMDTTGLKFLAWKGDKVLGAAAAKAMTKVTGIQEAGEATLLTSLALSNSFLAANSQMVLRPNKIIKFDFDTVDYSDRQWGTLVEATVGAIHEKGTSESFEAIENLTEWLLGKARQNMDLPTISATMTNFGSTNLEGILAELSRNMESSRSPNFLPTATSVNPKGRLLELGGSVESERNGGPDHKPVWVSTARWNDVTCTVSGTGKRITMEALAAMDLLQKIPVFLEDSE